MIVGFSNHWLKLHLTPDEGYARGKGVGHSSLEGGFSFNALWPLIATHVYVEPIALAVGQGPCTVSSIFHTSFLISSSSR